MRALQDVVEGLRCFQKKEVVHLEFDQASDEMEGYCRSS
jgi:hypothetical protein